MRGPIALTGSTGFVGRHLVKMLEDAGLLSKDKMLAGEFPDLRKDD